jgi:dihydroorotate dehydrogenase
VEYGTVTPLMQIGNPKPRLFRLLKEQALINAMGFNNKGVEYFIKNIKDYLQTSNKTFTKIGVNIGMNRDGKIDDYIFMLEKVANFADYVVVNISSPNTPGLRTIENDNTKLTQLLHNLNEKRKDMMNNIPILVKISPDNIDNNHIYNIANAIFDNKVDGIIISNTTIQCSDIRDKYNLYKGGLSGIPLFSISNDVLKSFYKLTSGKVPIIANGGVSSAHDVYTKIKLGASLVQIYTAFVYQGPGLINKIYRGLIDLLDRDGYKSISEAVGVGL